MIMIRVTNVPKYCSRTILLRYSSKMKRMFLRRGIDVIPASNDELFEGNSGVSQRRAVHVRRNCSAGQNALEHVTHLRVLHLKHRPASISGHYRYAVTHLRTNPARRRTTSLNHVDTEATPTCEMKLKRFHLEHGPVLGDGSHVGAYELIDGVVE